MGARRVRTLFKVLTLAFRKGWRSLHNKLPVLCFIIEEHTRSNIVMDKHCSGPSFCFLFFFYVLFSSSADRRVCVQHWLHSSLLSSFSSCRAWCALLGIHDTHGCRPLAKGRRAISVQMIFENNQAWTWLEARVNKKKRKNGKWDKNQIIFFFYFQGCWRVGFGLLPSVHCRVNDDPLCAALVWKCKWARGIRSR